MTRQTIHTEHAPEAIGTYSQAVRYGDLVFLSGQIPLIPETMELIDGNFEAQVRQVLNNLQAVCKAAGGDLNKIIKLNVSLVDMGCFPIVNGVMAEFFDQPYPARAAVGVASLPKASEVEIEAVMGL